LELTAHQAQHVILDRSTCSRNPVPMSFGPNTLSGFTVVTEEVRD